MKITEKEFNIQTGKETITERDETTAETKARLDAAKARADEQAITDAAATAKASGVAKLAALGFTEAEIAAW